jgi:hypothetical protein
LAAAEGQLYQTTIADMSGFLYETVTCILCDVLKVQMVNFELAPYPLQTRLGSKFRKNCWNLDSIVLNSSHEQSSLRNRNKAQKKLDGLENALSLSRYDRNETELFSFWSAVRSNAPKKSVKGIRP